MWLADCKTVECSLKQGLLEFTRSVVVLVELLEMSTASFFRPKHFHLRIYLQVAPKTCKIHHDITSVSISDKCNVYHKDLFCWVSIIKQMEVTQMLKYLTFLSSWEQKNKNYGRHACIRMNYHTNQNWDDTMKWKQVLTLQMSSSKNRTMVINELMVKNDSKMIWCQCCSLCGAIS